MNLFRVFDVAEFVPDACVMLDLLRLPPERSGELLAILEDLNEQIWTPLQFHDEYKNNRASARNENISEYYEFRRRSNSCRDKSLKLIKDVANRLEEGVNPSIVKHIEQGFALLDKDLPALRAQNQTESYVGIEQRIDDVLRDSVGDKLPELVEAELPYIWKWRKEQGTPPGLHDCDKSAPNRYGDLRGWVQVLLRAVKNERPIVLITNDVKANGWYAETNKKRSGPHPALAQELNDVAGVELHIFTCEDFIRIAKFYLRDRAFVSYSAKRPLRFPRIQPPDFGNIAAMQRIATQTGFNRSRYLNELSSLTALWPVVDMRVSILEALQNIINVERRLFRERQPPSINESFLSSVDQVRKAVQPGLESHLRADARIGSYYEQQRRRHDALFAERQHTVDATMKSIAETQQRIVDAIRKPYLEEHSRITDHNMRTYLRDLHSFVVRESSSPRRPRW